MGEQVQPLVDALVINALQQAVMEVHEDVEMEAMVRQQVSVLCMRETVYMAGTQRPCDFHAAHVRPLGSRASVPAPSVCL